MKFFNTIQVFAVSIAVFASCQQQAPETPGNDKLSGKELVAVTLQASMAQTKVTYAETTEKNLQPDWEKDDVVIGIDENGTPYKFTVSSVKADGSATITGEAPANCTMHLVYLGSATPASTEGLSLPYQISYDEQAGDKTIPAVMFADGNIAFGGGEFHFSNAGAVIGINATKGVPGGSTISKITVYGDNLSAATIALSGNKLILTAGGSTGESISTGDGFSATVSSDGKGTLVGNPVLIAVPAGAKVSKISAVVGSDNYIYTLQAPVTLAMNEYKYVLGKTFKSSKIPGILSGLFTVSDPDGIPDSGDEKKVRFSQGNLQFKAGDGTTAKPEWRFAEHQYDYIGNAPGNNTTDETTRSKQDAWIDLFGWGATGRTDINEYLAQPYSINDSDSYYKTIAIPSADETLTRANGGDWGVCMGDDWRTLSVEEWSYLLTLQGYDNTTRANKYKTGVTVCSVTGCVVVVPDVCLNGYIFDINKTSYTPEEWSVAEAGGLVCLPPAGSRWPITYLSGCNYWSSSSMEKGDRCPAIYIDMDMMFSVDISRCNGFSVRLVADATPEPAPIEYVDLGLSVDWATCNLGATKPEEYGEYFAWGATEGYKPTGNTFSHSFNWTNAPFNNGSSIFNSEYFNSVRNTVCPDNILASEYDAAHVIMGETWRMPKYYEFEELLNNTNNSWTSNYNSTGVSGYVFTSKTDPSKSIFLPAGNRADGTALNYLNEYGCYWLAEQDQWDDRFAWYISFSNGSASKSMDEHRYGMPIRAVRPK